ncbi:hypothetical protein RvY_00645-2 [Ramazzottius varieornatus]|uniref:Uncharacterized protein n=1 Tax=Ramazzottius varieornatus TaxID=947166 RepID=A0A1D1UH60_RAMVA|nr:hypothetical protein RvY_00645-2 [Ramazzottius varieornatus]
MATCRTSNEKSETSYSSTKRATEVAAVEGMYHALLADPDIRDKVRVFQASTAATRPRSETFCEVQFSLVPIYFRKRRHFSRQKRRKITRRTGPRCVIPCFFLVVGSVTSH